MNIGKFLKDGDGNSKTVIKKILIRVGSLKFLLSFLSHVESNEGILQDRYVSLKFLHV